MYNPSGGKGRCIFFDSESDWIKAMVAEFHLLVDSASDAGKKEFHASLAGGSTPLPLYRALADSPFLRTLEGMQIHLWVGDERDVPENSPSRNGKAIARAFAPSLGGTTAWAIPPVIHAWPQVDRPESASLFEKDLLSCLGESGGLELSILGMGADGHTAGLFPPMPDPREFLAPKPIVVLTQAPFEPKNRMSLGAGFLTRSEAIMITLRGEDKKHALEAFLRGEDSPVGCVAGAKGRVFYLDA
jgi:6-phosphogluconolactonase